MEFLRRLAPPCATDASRAVAVLPSRFSSDSPLRAVPAAPAPGPQAREDDIAVATDPSRTPAPRTPSPGAPRSPAPAQQARAAPPLPSVYPVELHAVTVRAHPETPDVEGRPAAQPLQAVPPARTAQSALPPVAPPHGAESAVPAPFEPARAAPLSPATLAQRAPQTGEDNQVIHVSIGRIDVVANVAPAPAAARTPKPRAGSVALADYLRGDNGSRR